MEVRDAVETDADRLADLTDTPRDVMVNLVHDRTVRVAVERLADASSDDGDNEDGGGGDEDEGGNNEDGGGGDEDAGDARHGNVRGFVSYDARENTVHVTQLEGDPESCDRLLEEPLRFAAAEGMRLEMLVPEDESDTRRAAEDAGFDRIGSGPAFDGRQTIRYRLDPR